MRIRLSLQTVFIFVFPAEKAVIDEHDVAVALFIFSLIVALALAGFVLPRKRKK